VAGLKNAVSGGKSAEQKRLNCAKAVAVERTYALFAMSHV
jgi:hypothetical protein